MTDTLFEIWKAIPGHSRYECSTQGRVRNARTGYVLSPFEDANNRGEIYERVDLYKPGGGRVKYYVHRLVLMTHRPVDDPDQFHGHHGPGGTRDNRLSNLSWLEPDVHWLVTHADLEGIFTHEVEEAPF